MVNDKRKKKRKAVICRIPDLPELKYIAKKFYLWGFINAGNFADNLDDLPEEEIIDSFNWDWVQERNKSWGFSEDNSEFYTRLNKLKVKRFSSRKDHNQDVKDDLVSKIVSRAPNSIKKLLKLVFEGKTIILEPDIGDYSYTLEINKLDTEFYSHTHNSLIFDNMNEKNLDRLADQLIGDILGDRPGLNWHVEKSGEVKKN